MLNNKIIFISLVTSLYCAAPIVAQTIIEMDQTCYGLQLMTVEALRRQSFEEAITYVAAARYIRPELRRLSEQHDCYASYFSKVEQLLATSGAVGMRINERRQNLNIQRTHHILPPSEWNHDELVDSIRSIRRIIDFGF